MSEWLALAAVVIGGLGPPVCPAVWQKVMVTYAGAGIAVAAFILGGFPHGPWVLPVLIFCFTRLVSSLWARSPIGALQHRPQRGTGGFTTFSTAAVALATNSLTAQHQQWIAYGIVLAAAYVATVTICQMRREWKWARALGWWDRNVAFSGGRPWGTMGNPMLTGTFFALTIPFTFQFLGWPALLFVPALVVLGARAALIGVLVSLPFLHSWWALTVIPVGLAALYAWRETILKSIWRPESGLGRVYSCGWSFEQLLRRPFWGWGENSINAPTPGAQHINTVTDFSHNALLDQLVHGGVVGLAAWALVILVAITHGASIPAVVGYLVAIQFVWHVPGPEQTFWVILGLWR